jgi:hypothetical protein
VLIVINLEEIFVVADWLGDLDYLAESLGEPEVEIE